MDKDKDRIQLINWNLANQVLPRLMSLPASQRGSEKAKGALRVAINYIEVLIEGNKKHLNESHE